MNNADSKTRTAAALQRKSSEQSPDHIGERAGLFGAEQQPSFFPAPIQAKLTVNKPGDSYEQEADKVADQVVQRLAENKTGPTPAESGKNEAKPNIQRLPITPIQRSAMPMVIQAKCAACESEEKLQKKDEDEPEVQSKIQRKPIFDSGAEPPDEGDGDDNVQRKPIFDSAAEEGQALQRAESADTAPSPPADFGSGLQSSKGGGSPLPADVSSSMGEAMGADLSNVRVHTDSRAVNMSKDIQAQAFTHGSDIYFNEGNYDTGSTEGKRLLAHELVHTVQQGGEGSVVPAIQKAPPPLPTSPPPPITAALLSSVPEHSKGSIEGDASKMIIRLQNFPLKGYADKTFADSNTPLQRSKKKRSTKQKAEWTKGVESDVRTSFEAVVDSSIRGDELSLTLKKGKGETKLVGTYEDILKGIIVPFWNKDGKPETHQIEHRIDWQVMGEKSDNIKNLMLIKKDINLYYGDVVKDNILGHIKEVLDHYIGKGVPLPADASLVASDKTYDISFKSFTYETVAPGHVIFDSFLKGANNPFNPIRKENIEVMPFEVPPGHFALRMSKSSPNRYVLPNTFESNFLSITRKKKEDAPTIILKKIVKTGTGMAPVPNNVPLTATRDKENYYTISAGGYSGIIQNDLKLNHFSPIVVAENDIELNPFTGFQAEGKVKSDIPLLSEVDISFSLVGDEFTVQAEVASDELKDKFPKPFSIDYSSLLLAVSSNKGLSIAGAIGFGIEKLGKGNVIASANPKGFALTGTFVFDSEKFQGSGIKFTYADKKWTITGNINITEKVKGFKSGSLVITYANDTITAKGSAELDIPGIEKATLDAVFKDGGEFLISGKVTLKSMPGIKSGGIVEASISKSAGAADYSLSISGAVEPNLPKIPKLSAKFSVSYINGLFKAEGKSNFEAKDGMISGEVTVGVTNGIVSGSVLQQGEGGGKISFYGKGTIKFIPYPGIEADLNVKINAKGEALYSAKVGAKIQPFGPIKPPPKDILKIKQTIPLVGVPFLTLNFTMGIGAQFYLEWLPLEIGVTGSLTDKTFDDIVAGKFDAPLALTLETKGKVGIEVSINAGASATVLVLEGGAEIIGSLKLEAEALLKGTLNAVWEGEKGLKMKGGKGEANASLNLIPALKGRVYVDLNLIVSRVNLWEYIKEVAQGEKILLFMMDVTAPFEFDENNKLKPIDPEAITFKPALNNKTAKAEADKTADVNKDSPSAPSPDDLVKQNIQQQVGENLRRKKSNTSIDMYAYASELRAHMSNSQEEKWKNYVNEAIETELRKIEEEEFNEFRSAIMASKEPVATKLAKVDAFEAQHKTLRPEWFKIMRLEIDQQGSSPPVANIVQTKPDPDSKATENRWQKEPKSSASVDNRPAIESTLDAAAGKGAQLPDKTSKDMQSAFGSDFSQVRIHDNSEAAAMNDAEQAKAFTHGNDIYFNKGQYNPDSKEGKHLIAHELTHTLQQNGNGTTRIQRKPATQDSIGSDENALKPMGKAAGQHGSPGTDFATKTIEAKKPQESEQPQPQGPAAPAPPENKQLSPQPLPQPELADHKPAAPEKEKQQTGLAPLAEKEPEKQAIAPNTRQKQEQQREEPPGMSKKAEAEPKAAGKTEAPDAPDTPADNKPATEAPGATAIEEKTLKQQASPAEKEKEMPEKEAPGKEKPLQNGTPAAAKGSAGEGDGLGQGGSAAGAAPPAAPLNGGSSKALADLLGDAKATELMEAMNQVDATTANIQQQEKSDLAESLPEIEQPTGLPVKDRKAETDAVKPTKATQPELKPAEGPVQPLPETAHAQVEGNIPLAKVFVPAPKAEDDPQYGENVKNAIYQLPVSDDNVNTSAGPRPQVDLSGPADPAQNQQFERESSEEVGAEKQKADAVVGNDFGENDIYPAIETETLRSSHEVQGPEATGQHAVGELPKLSAEGYQSFNEKSESVLRPQVDAEMGKHDAEHAKMEADNQLEREKTDQKIAEETESTKQQQESAQQNAKAEVEGHRTEWRNENEKIKKTYSDGSSKERAKVDKDIDNKVSETNTQVETEFAGAEAKANEEKRKAEAEAERKKQEAKNKKRSFWSRVASAVGDFFEGLKKLVNAIFDGLRKLVKGIIELAKKAVNKLIDLARDAIKGFIKAFGELLKGLVSIALAAFPEVAARINGYIDKAVEKASAFVDKLAEGLKKAVNALLDALGKVLDAILAAYQKVFNMLLDALKFIVVGILKILEGIANLVEAARNMPDHFWGQVSEEMLGVDVTKPLPNEAPMPNNKAALAEQQAESEAIGSAEKDTVQKPSLEPEDVLVEPVAHDFELDAALMQELASMPEEGSITMDTEAEGGPEEVEKVKAEALAGQPTAEENAASVEPLNEPSPEPGPVSDESTAPETTAGQELVGPFSGPGERLSHIAGQMKEAIIKWWDDNKVAIIAGLVLGILGVILANIITGGAILAALPLLMQIIGALFLAQAMANATKYFGNFLSEAFPGNILAGAVALARASAILIIEIVTSLLFVGKGAVKGIKAAAKTVAKQGVKGALKTGAKAAKTATVTAVKNTGKAVKELGRIAKSGGKATLKNGKLALKGIQKGMGRGAKNFGTLAKNIAKKMRLKRIKIERKKWRFFIFGEFNPWILLASGEIKRVDAKDIKNLNKTKVGEKVKVFKPDGSEAVAKLITKSDSLPKGVYKRIFEMATGETSVGKVIHHLIEQQTMKMAKIGKDFINHAKRLKPFPQGIINDVLHLSKGGIRGMWDDFYKIVLPQLKSGQITNQQFIDALIHFSKHTDDFIEHTIKSIGKNPSRSAIENTMKLWRAQNKTSKAIKNALDSIK